VEKKKTRSLFISLFVAALLIVVIGVVLLVVHQHSKNNQSLTQAQQSSAKAQIETNWKTFFAASTSLQQREALLQNGSKFTQPIQTEFSSLGSESSSADIVSVSLKGSTQAGVVYNVELNKQPVLINQKGVAIFLNNTWEVSDQTLCQLLKLGGDQPAACQGI
jgi:predicted PurR-regulated permease PerM